jgi:hypothetical protein
MVQGAKGLSEFSGGGAESKLPEKTLNSRRQRNWVNSQEHWVREIIAQSRDRRWMNSSFVSKSCRFTNLEIGKNRAILFMKLRPLL